MAVGQVQSGTSVAAHSVHYGSWVLRSALEALTTVGARLGLCTIGGSKQHITAAARQLSTAVLFQDKLAAQTGFAKALLLFSLKAAKEGSATYPEYQVASLWFQCAELGERMSTLSLEKPTPFMSKAEWKAAVRQAALELAQEEYLHPEEQTQKTVARVSTYAQMYARAQYPTSSESRRLSEQRVFCQKLMNASPQTLNSEVAKNMQQLIQLQLTPKPGLLYRGAQLLAGAALIAAAYDGVQYYRTGAMPTWEYGKELKSSVETQIGELQQRDDYKSVMKGLEDTFGALKGYYQQLALQERLTAAIQKIIPESFCNCKGK